MLFPSSKVVELSDGFSLVEPSLDSYRSCIRAIIRMGKDEEDKIDSGKYNAAMVLMCLHHNSVPVVLQLVDASSIAEAFDKMEHPEQDLDKYTKLCPARFLQECYQTVDEQLVPHTKSAEDKVKN